MVQKMFPPLPLAEWRDTRDLIQGYAQVVGKIRQALTPPQRHWFHVCLQTSGLGLSSTPIRFGNITFEMLLDFSGHQLVISTSHGGWAEVDLDGHSAREFYDDAVTALADLSIEVALDRDQFSDTDGTYDPDMVEDYWQAISQIDMVLKEFMGELRGRKGPICLWPHHLDLAGLWFTGNLVPGKDPDDEENADEQMNFGFSTGDEGIPDAYFYITAYPWPEGLETTTLPGPVRWQTEGWKGAVMMYDDLIKAENPRETLLNFLKNGQAAGAERMI